MKKFFNFGIIACLTAAFVFNGCKEEEETITRIEITEGETINLIVGQNQQLHVKHFPEHLKAPKYNWTTSDVFVASANYGEIKANSEGKTVITVTTDNNISASCNVVVSAIEITGITIDKSEYEILIGNELQLNPKVSPNDATYKDKLVYSSTDETVAKVGKNGKVETVGVGECQIKVTSNDGKISTTCNIKILPTTLNKTEFEAIIGEHLQLQPTAIADVYKNKLVYTSTNESVAKVSSEGVIETIGVGECTITAASTDGKIKADCKVKVLPSEVTSISLNQNELTIMQSETFSFETTIEPKIAADKTVTWTTSDESIATIDASGVLTAIGIGECTIIAHSSNAEVTAQCNVKVITATAKEVQLNKSSIKMIIGTTYNLQATVLPNAANPNVTWVSSNTNVATVENGVVTAVAVGSAVITVTTEEGGLQQSCSVTVEGIEKYISAQHGTVSTTFSGGGSYNSISCEIVNNSSVDIYVKNCLINSYTRGDADITLYSGQKYSPKYTGTIISTGNNPTVIWTIEYNGIEYTIYSTYNASFGFDWSIIGL